MAEQPWLFYYYYYYYYYYYSYAILLFFLGVICFVCVHVRFINVDFVIGYRFFELAH